LKKEAGSGCKLRNDELYKELEAEAKKHSTASTSLNVTFIYII